MKIHDACVLWNFSTWNLSQSGIPIQDTHILFSNMWIPACLSDAASHLSWYAKTSDLSWAMWAPLHKCAGQWTQRNKVPTILPNTIFIIASSYAPQNIYKGKKPGLTVCSWAFFYYLYHMHSIGCFICRTIFAYLMVRHTAKDLQQN